MLWYQHIRTEKGALSFAPQMTVYSFQNWYFELFCDIESHQNARENRIVSSPDAFPEVEDDGQGENPDR